MRSSGKRHLIITGSRGSGKSTLLRGLFPPGTPGITTKAIPKEAVILFENSSGQHARIGVYCDELPGEHNKMLPAAEGLLSFGVPALIRLANSPQEWTLIDEIGYLETSCEEYISALRSLFNAKRVAAVVRRQSLPFPDELLARGDALVVDLDDLFGGCGCVIMASGEGKRFGGNKLMADFGGRPLIDRALRATAGIFAQRVVVTRHKEVADYCRSQGCEVLLHDLPLRSDTVRLGLSALPGVNRCLFCPGDQPLLRRDTVASLALCAKNDPGFIWRTAYEGCEGAPVLFPLWAFDALKALPDGKGGGYVIHQNRALVRTTEAGFKEELDDVDTPQDLLRLSSLRAAE